MPFDEDPQDDIERYPCECGGEITFSKKLGRWECDSCSFSTNGADNGQTG